MSTRSLTGPGGPFDSVRAGRTIRVRDLAACLVALFALTGVAFLPYALHGGFFSDDWATASDVRVAPGTGYTGAVHQISQELGARPLLAVALPLPHVVLGESPRAHVLLGLLLGIVTCLCFFAMLRVLGLAPGHAIAIASLALLFPWADSVRFWPSAAVNTIAAAFFFLGVVCALLGLERDGPPAWVLGGVGTAFYLASVLTYEVAGLAACLVGAPYLRRAPRARALRRWALDVLVVLAALAWSAHATRGVRHVASPSQVLSDLPSFVRQSSSLLAAALLSFPSLDVGVAKAAVLLVAAGVVVIAVRCFVRDGGAELGRWLSVIGVSAVALAAAYAMLLGSFLHPLDSGLDNRGNLLAAFAFAGFIYGLIVLGAMLAPSRFRALVGVTVFALVVGGYVMRLQRDGSDWRRAHAEQSRVLVAIDHQLPGLPAGTTLVAVGFPGETAPGVPVFDATWDLEGALRLQHRDPKLSAFPLFADGTLSCTDVAAIAAGPGSFGRNALSYRRLVVVSPTGHAWITNRADCERAAVAFPLRPRLRG
jgi:MFS family permease